MVLLSTQHTKKTILKGIHYNALFDTNIKTCHVTNCNVISQFNYKDSGYGLYCYEHKKNDMVFINYK
jgi:hypothetical protein